MSCVPAFRSGRKRGEHKDAMLPSDVGYKDGIQQMWIDHRPSMEMDVDSRGLESESNAEPENCYSAE